MNLRLGQILIERGVLTTDQCERVALEQSRTGEPFGLLCERLCGVDPQAIEEAWADQYTRMSTMIDPCEEEVDPAVLGLLTRRQAWQFRVLPLRFEGRELIVATTSEHLRRALRFATAVIGVPVYLVLATPEALGEALYRHYPMAGLGPQSINDGCAPFTRAV